MPSKKKKCSPNVHLCVNYISDGYQTMGVIQDPIRAYELEVLNYAVQLFFLNPISACVFHIVEHTESCSSYCHSGSPVIINDCIQVCHHGDVIFIA